MSNNSPEESELISDLKSLNIEILNNKRETRGFFSWKTLDVAIADVEGALAGGKAGAYLGGKLGLALGSPHTGAVTFAFIGGVGVGAFNSYRAYRNYGRSLMAAEQPLPFSTIADVCVKTVSDDLTISDQNLASSQEMADKLIIDDDVKESVQLEEKFLNIGQLHNVVLGVADGTVILCSESKIDNPTIASIVESQDFQDMYDEVTYKLQNNIEIEREPLEQQVIDLFCEVFQQYSTDCTDVVFIINKYLDILEKSAELTEVQLNSIKIGLATSLYSFNYWDKTFNK